MRIDLLGVIAVRDGGHEVEGAALGGRRARVALAALALADGPVPAERLARVIWGERLPNTWQPALRGIVRSLRSALEPLGGGEQNVVATAPSGYRLADGVEVDVREVHAATRTASAHLAAGDARAAFAVADEAASTSGAQLLPGVEAEWLDAHRAQLDEAAVHAGEQASLAASALGDHSYAVAIARRTVAARPLDERAHRSLIVALDGAGDRAGAVRAYEHCRAVLADELGVDPSAETVTAYLNALSDVPAGPSSARVPTHRSTFVGRENEVRALRDALGEPGVVTLVGRGGVGKSRLAAQVARPAELPGGRAWVSLASVSVDELVPSTVALGLGVQAGADVEAALARHLAPLGRSLLVLDGCDVVTDGVASLVSALAASCPALTVLATSRSALGVEDERTIAVATLPEGDQLRLLTDRLDSPTDDADTRDLLVDLCRRCDGLPLALELAAAQLDVIPVGDLLDQLAHVDVRDDDELRAITRGSYDLLDADEATVFRRMAVLDGPAGVALVRAVVAAADVAPVRVVRILRELAARGLVVVDRAGARWRYEQDDDLHRFARELLAAEGGEAQAFDRLATYLLSLLPDDAARPPAPYADEVSAVLGSVRSLLGAGADHRADLDRCLELAFRLHRYWAMTAVGEGVYWLQRLLADARAQSSAWAPHATYALGYLTYWIGDSEQAIARMQSAIEQFGTDTNPFVARAYFYLGGLLDDVDRPDEAIAHVRTAMQLAETLGADTYVASSMGLASLLSERGDPDAADAAEAAVARCRADGSAEQLAILLPTAAMASWMVGNAAAAQAYADEARPMHRTGKRIARVILLSVSAGLALARGEHDEALEHAGTADVEGTELGVMRELPIVRSVLARAHLARGDRDAARAAALSAVEAGAGLDYDYQAALGLETVALVAASDGVSDDPVRRADLATLLATAAAIRAAGRRLAPAPLRPEVAALARRLSLTGAVLPLPEAVTLARQMSSAIPGDAG